jgi:hypothetical protein
MAKNVFILRRRDIGHVVTWNFATKMVLSACPPNQTTVHPFTDLQKSRFKPAQAVLHMIKLPPLVGCLSVAARLLGLVEVVLDAQVILHGGLVLEEPLAELAGHAAHRPVLVPKNG